MFDCGTRVMLVIPKQGKAPWQGKAMNNKDTLHNMINHYAFVNNKDTFPINH